MSVIDFFNHISKPHQEGFLIRINSNGIKIVYNVITQTLIYYTNKKTYYTYKNIKTIYDFININDTINNSFKKDYRKYILSDILND